MKFVSQNVETDQWKIDDIENLKKEIISNLKDYSIIEKVVDVGRVHIYKRNNQLQLISIFSEDQYLTYLKDWYFFNGQLIYTEQNIVEKKSGHIIDTEKMYLLNYHLLSWVRSEKEVNPETVLFKKTEMDVLSLSVKLRAELIN